jgi:hypothetical protein
VGGDDKPSGERKYTISLAESSTNLLLVEMVIQLKTRDAPSKNIIVVSIGGFYKMLLKDIIYSLKLIVGRL